MASPSSPVPQNFASEFVYFIEAGNAVEFSTMTTHGIGAHGKRPVTILTILTQDGQRAPDRVRFAEPPNRSPGYQIRVEPGGSSSTSGVS